MGAAHAARRGRGRHVRRYNGLPALDDRLLLRSPDHAIAQEHELAELRAVTCTHDAETRRDGKQGAAGEDNDVVTIDADRHERVRPWDPGRDVSSRHKAPGLA